MGCNALLRAPIVYRQYFAVGLTIIADTFADVFSCCLHSAYPVRRALHNAPSTSVLRSRCRRAPHPRPLPGQTGQTHHKVCRKAKRIVENVSYILCFPAWFPLEGALLFVVLVPCLREPCIIEVRISALKNEVRFKDVKYGLLHVAHWLFLDTKHVVKMCACPDRQVPTTETTNATLHIAWKCVTASSISWRIFSRDTSCPVLTCASFHVTTRYHSRRPLFSVGISVLQGTR